MSILFLIIITGFILFIVTAATVAILIGSGKLGRKGPAPGAGPARICPHCSVAIGADDRYCYSCGKPATLLCPRCGQPLQETPEAMTCPGCGFLAKWKGPAGPV